MASKTYYVLHEIVDGAKEMKNYCITNHIECSNLAKALESIDGQDQAARTNWENYVILRDAADSYNSRGTAAPQLAINLAAFSAPTVNILARTVLHSVAKAFEDPRVAAEYKQWKQERDARLQARR